KILFTKMGNEGDLIGSANSIQINPSLQGMRASFCCCAAWLLVKMLYSGYGRLSSPNSERRLWRALSSGISYLFSRARLCHRMGMLLVIDIIGVEAWRDVQQCVWRGYLRAVDVSSFCTLADGVVVQRIYCTNNGQYFC